MHFEEDEVRMEKKQLFKKQPLNMSALTDNRSCTDLNKAFVDKSRIDTSNMMCDEGGILDAMQLDKSNISTYECSRCKKLMFENRMQQQIIQDLKKNSKEQPLDQQNFSFENGVVKGQDNNGGMGNNDEFYNINKDLVLSGSHIKDPNTFELSREYSVLEKSIGKIAHNRSISIIKFPSNHHRIESVIKHEEVFN